MDAVGYRPMFLASAAGRWAAMLMYVALVHKPRTLGKPVQGEPGPF